jgi:hypothetical protein
MFSPAAVPADQARPLGAGFLCALLAIPGANHRAAFPSSHHESLSRFISLSSHDNDLGIVIPPRVSVPWRSANAGPYTTRHKPIVLI